MGILFFLHFSIFLLLQQKPDLTKQKALPRHQGAFLPALYIEHSTVNFSQSQNRINYLLRKTAQFHMFLVRFRVQAFLHDIPASLPYGRKIVFSLIQKCCYKGNWSQKYSFFQVNQAHSLWLKSRSSWDYLSHNLQLCICPLFHSIFSIILS